MTTGRLNFLAQATGLKITGLTVTGLAAVALDTSPRLRLSSHA